MITEGVILALDCPYERRFDHCYQYFGQALLQPMPN